ncbi:hypothetical protein [Acidovorax sp. Leaf78]|uniref:hypothetical protein n=1 Tax=unclassified Acidovorax TaxID=2684926 RepID=UPI0006F90AC1|nr:hypothetical protein [Acidovorax sp. Leaf78]KQO16847.1 hypothetical protein ASF16_13175 [Acidovorax sp. Leaf78]RZJ62828.1 MAG: hypothetical protein EON49_00990 [Acidovorax sp.]
MDRVIVYVDDAAYAEQVLAPLFARDASRQTEWVLVACAPRMTHRISKWVSHSARENWRAKWADKLFSQILPALRAPASSVTTVVAKGPLVELTEQLQAAQPSAAQVVDARRPKADNLQEQNAAGRHWSSPRPGTLLGSLLTGFGVLWVLALE